MGWLGLNLRKTLRSYRARPARALCVLAAGEALTGEREHLPLLIYVRQYLNDGDGQELTVTTGDRQHAIYSGDDRRPMPAAARAMLRELLRIKRAKPSPHRGFRHPLHTVEVSRPRSKGRWVHRYFRWGVAACAAATMASLPNVPTATGRENFAVRNAYLARIAQRRDAIVLQFTLTAPATQRGPHSAVRVRVAGRRARVELVGDLPQATYQAIVEPAGLRAGRFKIGRRYDVCIRASRGSEDFSTVIVRTLHSRAPGFDPG